jgi:hypothetical protein
MGKRILLYGKSVMIAGLASSLERTADVEITRGEDLNIIELNIPDLILVDLCEVETARALPRLCSFSGVTLVGIDPTNSTMTVLSGKSQAAQSMQELMEFLSDLIKKNPNKP